MKMKKSLGVLFLVFSLLLSSMAMAMDLVDPANTEVPVIGGTESFYQLGDISVSLDTTATTRTLLEGESSFVVINVESTSGPAAATLTLTGLIPSTTYYIYVDNLHSAQELVSDAAGQLSFSQSLTGPHMITVKNLPSTYFISKDFWYDGNGVFHPAGWSYSDGTDLNGVVGTWDAATLTATMITDLDEPLEILSSNVTLDGNGYLSTRNPNLPTTSIGIYAYGQDYLTIKNLVTSEWQTDIMLKDSNYAKITKNRFTTAGRHVRVDYSQSTEVFDNYFTGMPRGWFGVSLSVFPMSYGTHFHDNVTEYTGYMVEMSNLSGSTIIENNTVYAVRAYAITSYKSEYDIIRGNTFQFMSGPAIRLYSTAFAKVYNNNFLHITAYDPIMDHAPTNNTFNEPLPVGGNYYDDWVSPDVNSDGFVDIPRHNYDRFGDYYGNITSYDNLPYVERDGWKRNLPPEFVAIAPIETVEYEEISFTLEATDPNGDDIVTVYVENLPNGAFFDPVNQTFDWRPDGTQAGNYVVSFFAVDSGTPTATGQSDVIITVGEVTSPSDMNTTLTTEVQTLDLLPAVELSYSANLLNADQMIDKGNITAVVNQYEVILHKIQQDLKHGAISQDDADTLTMMANDAINLLN